MRRVLGLAAAILSAGALAPAGAGAATTVGQNFVPTLQVGTKATVLQLQASAGTAYTVPFDGILTSWSFRAAEQTEPTRFKVGRPAGGSQFTIIGQSDSVTPTPEALSSYPIRIPVKAGDVIGLYQEVGNTFAGARSESDSDQVAYAFGSDAQPGETPNYFQISKIRFNISASLEVDQDRDGFGDDTQDGCPVDFESHEPCTADLAVAASQDKTTLGAFEEMTMNYVVSNAGRTPGFGAALTYPVPKELELVSFTSTTATCSGKATVRCSFGDLPVGASQLVTIKVRAKSPGKIENKATLASRVLDPDINNNSAPLPVTILFKPGRCANAWSGNSDNNSLLGSTVGDLFQGLEGHDLLAGLAGDDCLIGGPGDDRLIGGTGADSLDGDGGEDSLSGDSGNDTLTGGDEGDVLSGGTGNDRITGDSGNDRITGSSGKDRIDAGIGVDRIKAGSADDSVSARDGERDFIDCGAGKKDRATVDRRDRVRNCEGVRRR